LAESFFIMICESNGIKRAKLTNRRDDLCQHYFTPIRRCENLWLRDWLYHNRRALSMLHLLLRDDRASRLGHSLREMMSIGFGSMIILLMAPNLIIDRL
jgi:hypothetical protein